MVAGAASAPGDRRRCTPEEGRRQASGSVGHGTKGEHYERRRDWWSFRRVIVPGNRRAPSRRENLKNLPRSEANGEPGKELLATRVKGRMTCPVGLSSEKQWSVPKPK